MAEIYDTARFGELYYASRSPSTTNLGLAARYITQVLQINHVSFAIMGGWAMFLRGGGRRTQDVDLVVQMEMSHLKNLLIAQPRVCFPKIHGQTCVQIFVWTGRSFDIDAVQVDDVAVSIDLVISGNLGTPCVISTARESIVPSPVTHLSDSVFVLDVANQISAKLCAFCDRQHVSNNDYQDLIFLLASYPEAVQQVSHQLDLVQRSTFLSRYATDYAAFPEAIETIRLTLGL